MQEQVVRSVLQGRDTLALLPTGEERASASSCLR